MLNLLTDGHIIKPNGPSSRWKGIAISCSRQNINNGSENVSVLPEPVYAIPIKSLPINLVMIRNNFNIKTKIHILFSIKIAYKAGNPCIWIGVGLFIPFSFSACIIDLGNFMSFFKLNFE